MPEESKDFVHIPVPGEEGKHSGHKIRTKTISKKKGISALYCIDDKKVITFLFAKTKGWTLKKAQDWVRKRKNQIVYECKVCNNIFLDYAADKRQTCSTRCQYEYLSKINTGNGHPQYKGGMESIICEQCGKLFKTYKTSSQRYCSVKCHNSSMKIEKEIGTCPICEKKFTHYPSSPQIYCSKKCSYIGHAKFIKNLYKNRPLSESQLEALEKGRLNGFGGSKTECNDKHIAQSKFEAEFDNWLFEQNINHNTQIRVCKERAWTCDFVLIGNNGKTLWVEVDGMGKLREEYGHKETWEEKLEYYKENNFYSLVVDKKNIEEQKKEINKWWAEKKIDDLKLKNRLEKEINLSELLLEAEDAEVEKLMNTDRVIFMFGGIYEYTAQEICKKLLAYNKMDSKRPITLIIGSYGGGVYPSFAITDTMEYVKAPVNTIGIGWVMSGGLLIFMAGDNRQISQTASILSHRFSTFQGGSQAELKAAEIENKRVHKRMIEHYIKFSNLNTIQEVEAKLLQETDTWLNPEEAMEFDLADDYFDNSVEVKEALQRLDELKPNKKALVKMKRNIEEAKRGGSTLKDFVETVRVDYIEGGDKDEPFTFGGVMLKVDHENENGRIYPKRIAEDMVGEANLDLGLVTVEMGHPKNKKDTSPEREIGHLTSLFINDDGEAVYEGEVYNTSLGKDAQEWLRSKPAGTAKVSLRANGHLKKERHGDAFRERVVEGHLLGVDFVKKGGFGKYGRVTDVSESENSGGEEGMELTKKELLELERVQELIKAAEDKAKKDSKDALDKSEKAKDAEIKEGKDRIKELETEKATAETQRDALQGEKDEAVLAEFKKTKIEETKAAPKIKELLFDRVSGKSEEEIAESIKNELAYVETITPLLKEAKVHGIPPKGSEMENTKTEEEKTKDLFKNDRNYERAREMDKRR